MATLRNKQKLAAVSKDTQEIARIGLSRNIFVPGMTEEYIIQVSEKLEGRVSENLSQEFIQTESRFLGALSKLDKFLQNPQVRTCSGTVPGTFRNNSSENREPSGDRSRMIPIPKWSSLFVWPALRLTQTKRRPLTLAIGRFRRKKSTYGGKDFPFVINYDKKQE